MSRPRGTADLLHDLSAGDAASRRDRPRLKSMTRMDRQHFRHPNEICIIPLASRAKNAKLLGRPLGGQFELLELGRFDDRNLEKLPPPFVRRKNAFT
jgi:hypothetical protein